MQKPITIIRKELIDEIVEAINKSGLSFFIIEPALRDILDSIHASMRAQEEKDLAEYGAYLQKIKEADTAEDNAAPPEAEG